MNPIITVQGVIRSKRNDHEITIHVKGNVDEFEDDFHCFLTSETSLDEGDTVQVTGSFSLSKDSFDDEPHYELVIKDGVIMKSDSE